MNPNLFHLALPEWQRKVIQALSAHPGPLVASLPTLSRGQGKALVARRAAYFTTWRTRGFPKWQARQEAPSKDNTRVLVSRRKREGKTK